MSRLAICAAAAFVAACQLRVGDFAEYPKPILPETMAYTTVYEYDADEVRQRCKKELPDYLGLMACAIWSTDETGDIVSCDIHLPDDLPREVREAALNHEYGHCQEGDWH